MSGLVVPSSKYTDEYTYKMTKEFKCLILSLMDNQLQSYYNQNKVFSKELLEVFSPFLEELSDDARQLLYYRFMDALTMKEIATILGVADSTVGRHVRALVRNMKKGFSIPYNSFLKSGGRVLSDDPVPFDEPETLTVSLEKEVPSFGTGTLVGDKTPTKEVEGKTPTKGKGTARCESTDVAPTEGNLGADDGEGIVEEHLRPHVANMIFYQKSIFRDK